MLNITNILVDIAKVGISVINNYTIVSVKFSNNEIYYLYFLGWFSFFTLTASPLPIEKELYNMGNSGTEL